MHGLCVVGAWLINVLISPLSSGYLLSYLTSERLPLIKFKGIHKTPLIPRPHNILFVLEIRQILTAKDFNVTLKQLTPVNLEKFM